MKQLYLFIIAACIAITGIIFIPNNVNAADKKDFNAGYIIDDAIFYNANAMTASQVQQFLEAKNPNCDYNGTQPASDWGYPNLTHAKFAEYKRNGSNGIAKDTGFHAPPYKCLTRYTQETPQMEASSSYCEALPAGKRTAAVIIVDIARACGINPQVLIVLLEKEQSLVMDTWPLNRQLRNATGFACPDTAPCDPAYEGFFYQVYYAARQFKIYQAHPNSYNYRAGRNNNIYYNPDLNRCGSSTVYIHNQATAGLYIYTPYQPNKAALDDMYGNGDSCSAYGNRNFWRIFTDWFGSTRYKLQGSIGDRYVAINGESTLGAAKSNEISLETGGKYQLFEKGRIYWKSGVGAWEVKGSIGARYHNIIDGDAGVLGYPKSDEKTLSGGVKYQEFENGRIYWKSGVGAWEVNDHILEGYIDIGAEKSRLGLPIDGTTPLKTGGIYQQFEKGRIYWKSNTGAWDLGGSIGARYYTELAADASPLGYPVASETTLPSGVKYQEFERGRIYWKSKVGTYSTYGKIGEYYASINFESSRLGIPIGHEVRPSTGGVYQQFEKGRIYWKSNTGAWDLGGSIGARYYTELAADASPLGYPVASETTLPSGVKYQEFERGRIYWKSKVGTYSTYGKIGEYYASINFESSRLGIPIGHEVRPSTGGVYQQFEKGRIYWKSNTGAWDLGGSIGSKYYSLGGDKSKLGYPISAESKASNGSITQKFQHGSITYYNKQTTYKIN